MPVLSPSKSVLLFDLDDTLYDHFEAARSATQRVLELDAGLSDVGFEAVFRELQTALEVLHRDVAVGKLDVDTARLERWRRVLNAFGGDVQHAARYAAHYRDFYLEAERSVPGAKALLQRCVAQGKQLAIVSNNLRAEQLRKLRKLELEQFFSVVTVSGDHGYSKPDARLFHQCLRELGVAAGEAVMIGDNWTADVEGAEAAGLAAIWFNRHGAPLLDPRVPVIRSLAELDACL
jgi:HAD superfamily hydrolase (TIGR01549 family)